LDAERARDALRQRARRFCCVLDRRPRLDLTGS
jgi:hypothetical protein